MHINFWGCDNNNENYFYKIYLDDINPQKIHVSQ
jgi:hypothetical protein